MEEDFDPYLTWLGIREPARPPHHYRLLGLEPFEADPRVIENGADRQMTHVRSYHATTYGAISQKLLNELTAAKLCLLNNARKAEYDQRLRAQLQKPAGATSSNAATNAGNTQATGQRGGLAGALDAIKNDSEREFVREIGSGGMGVLYLTRHRMLDRLEAVKILNKSVLDGSGAAERFLKEIRAAGQLSHPNIITAYTAYSAGDELVYCMEYVDGKDLCKTVESEGRLSVANAAHYIQQAALGLQEAHEKGLVHRDIKPDNLILSTKSGKHVVKILDFGIAKAVREGAEKGGQTQSGQMLGTPWYIAPEQSLDAHRADIRADIYSLGCTLYFLLAGRPPFTGNSLYEILHAHQSTPAMPLDQVRSDVPRELAAIVGRMMAKRPQDRFQAPRDVAAALQPFAQAGAAISPGMAAPVMAKPAAMSPVLATPALANPAPASVGSGMYAPARRCRSRRNRPERPWRPPSPHRSRTTRFRPC